MSDKEMTGFRGAGRPTKYNEQVQAQADYYLYNWDEAGDVIPSVVGMCCYIGVPKSTVYDWAKKPECAEFSDTLKAIEALQEREAVNKGISGEFNATITKLVLANHGYSDKIQSDHTSSDGSMTPSRIEITAPNDSQAD